MRQYADNQLYELLDKGISCVYSESGWTVQAQVGAYQQLGNAVTMGAGCAKTGQYDDHDGRKRTADGRAGTQL